jgi:hypothetical protein
MVARAPIGPLTLMSAPHHGSKHSSSAALLAAVRPSEVLVQAGYRNRFGHPDVSVLARYAQAGIAVARTDWGGALQWRMKTGAQPAVTRSAARESMRRYWFNRPGAPLPARLEEAVSTDGSANDPVDLPEPKDQVDPSQAPDPMRTDFVEAFRSNEN